jgi:hypothetical protein
MNSSTRLPPGTIHSPAVPRKEYSRHDNEPDVRRPSCSLRVLPVSYQTDPDSTRRNDNRHLDARSLPETI